MTNEEMDERERSGMSTPRTEMRKKIAVETLKRIRPDLTFYDVMEVLNPEFSKEHIHELCRYYLRIENRIRKEAWKERTAR